MMMLNARLSCLLPRVPGGVPSWNTWKWNWKWNWKRNRRWNRNGFEMESSVAAATQQTTMATAMENEHGSSSVRCVVQHYNGTVRLLKY